MSKVLYIAANPKTVEQSASLSLGEAFLKAFHGSKPNDEIIVIDLYRNNIPEIDFDLNSRIPFWHRTSLKGEPKLTL